LQMTKTQSCGTEHDIVVRGGTTSSPAVAGTSRIVRRSCAVCGTRDTKQWRTLNGGRPMCLN
jgi:hypothetical protein